MEEKEENQFFVCKLCFRSRDVNKEGEEGKKEKEEEEEILRRTMVGSCGSIYGWIGIWERIGIPPGRATGKLG